MESANAMKGGFFAHVVRRLIHVSILFIALFYNYFLVVHVPKKILTLSVLLVIFLVFLFEKLRIRMKLVLFGQRLNEASRVSAFAWTVLSLGIVLLVLPQQFAIPIVAVCAFVDPLMGELRAHAVNKMVIIILGILLALIIWIVCAHIYHFSYWRVILPALIAVVVEQPNFPWVDDNALMMLVPMLVVLLSR